MNSDLLANFQKAQQQAMAKEGITPMQTMQRTSGQPLPAANGHVAAAAPSAASAPAARPAPPAAAVPAAVAPAAAAPSAAPSSAPPSAPAAAAGAASSAAPSSAAPLGASAFFPAQSFFASHAAAAMQSSAIRISNSAAKAKSEPRPDAPGAAKPAGKAGDNAYAASVLSNGAAPPPMKFTLTTAAPSSKAIYSAPPPPARKLDAGSTAAPSSSSSGAAGAPLAASSSALHGPVPTVVRSATNANVSILRPPPTMFDSSKCAECGPTAELVIDPHQGVEVCTNCGLIAGNYISDESEWRTFSDRRGEDPNRVGGPEIGLLADAGLATMMGDSPTGLNSNLAKLQNKNALSSNHRILMDAFKKSSRISTLLSLPQSITDRANELFKLILESGVMRPRGDVLIATCLFIVCKKDRVPRTIKEVCQASDVSQKELARCRKEIKKARLLSSLRAVDNDATDQELFVLRWANQLKLERPLAELARRIAKRAVDKLHTSRDPGSVGGAAIYIASQLGEMGKEKPLNAIASMVGISESTIRSVVATILERRAEILPAQHIDADIKL